MSGEVRNRPEGSDESRMSRRSDRRERWACRGMSEARETKEGRGMDLTAWPSPLFSLGSSLPCPLRSIDSRVTEERGEEQTRKREEVSDGGTGWVSDQVTRKDGCGTKGRNRKGMVWERSDPSPSLTIPSSPSLPSLGP